MTNLQPLPLPMITPQPPPLTSVEEQFAYFYHSLFLGGADKEAVDAIDQIGEITAEEWIWAWETMIKASGLHNGSEKDQLAFWLNKPATWDDAVMRQQQVMVANNEAAAMGGPQKPLPPLHSWESYRAAFPREAESDWLRFQRLRAKYLGEVAA